MARAAIAEECVNQTAREGDTVTFALKISGSVNTEYQWQTTRPELGSWTDIKDSTEATGANTPVLRLKSVPFELNGSIFRLVIREQNNPPVYCSSERLLVVQTTGVEIGGLKRVLLTESSEAFQNPMKGFRPTRYYGDPAFKAQEYASVFKHYIRYTDLESSPADTVEKIIEWSNRAWAGIEDENVKVIPRVVIYYPDNDEFWAEGIPHEEPPYKESNWTNAVLKKRLVGMITKLGAAWDRDPRVAAIELGLWGKWGEHHIDPATISVMPTDPADPSRIPPEFQVAMGDAANRSFKTKKVLIRYSGDTFKDYQFGCYWDSFALPEDAVSGEAEIAKDNWRSEMNSGEVAFDWGTKAAVGGSPDGALLNMMVADHINEWIRRTHTSSLGWISEYNPNVPVIERNAQAMQKAMGYRYVVKEAVYSSEVKPSSKLSVKFTVTNVGSAPFYYPWPVQAALLRQDSSVAWRGTFSSDITRWVSCQDYTVSDEFEIPHDLAKGTYLLALCVCDPAGMLPSLRFANSNYLRGGWTPIGKVGVSEDVDDAALKPFDSIANDHSLKYVVTGARRTIGN